MKTLRFLCLLLFASQACATEPLVYQRSVEQPADKVYDAVYSALEEANFYVVFEANIGKNLAGFAERWGDDYNRSGLSEIRSMVFCNGWYANQVSNLDPTMLGFCPLHLTVIEKNTTTTVLFNRPSVAAGNSPAVTVLKEAESGVIGAIDKALGL